MAKLRITQSLTGLRRDVPSKVTAGSTAVQLLAALRQIAADALPLVTELRLADNYGLLTISQEVGVLTPVGSLDADTPDAAEGFMVNHIDVIIADDLAYDHRGEGPVRAYIDAVLAGQNTVFDTIPGSETFFTDVGLTNPAEQISIGSSIIFCG